MRSQLENLYGPVPIGCAVPNSLENDGELAEPPIWSALYFFSASGLAMEKAGSVSPDRKVDDAEVKVKTAVLSSLAWQDL